MFSLFYKLFTMFMRKEYFKESYIISDVEYV